MFRSVFLAIQVQPSGNFFVYKIQLKIRNVEERIERIEALETAFKAFEAAPFPQDQRDQRRARHAEHVRNLSHEIWAKVRAVWTSKTPLPSSERYAQGDTEAIMALLSQGTTDAQEAARKIEQDSVLASTAKRKLRGQEASLPIKWPMDLTSGGLGLQALRITPRTISKRAPRRS